jgi:hypothetical protein
MHSATSGKAALFSITVCFTPSVFSANQLLFTSHMNSLSCIFWIFIFPVACIIIICVSAQLYAHGIVAGFRCSQVVVMWEQWYFLVIVHLKYRIQATPCCLVDSYCFRGSCCLLLQGKWLSQVWIYGVASPGPVHWVTLEKWQEYWLVGGSLSEGRVIRRGGWKSGEAG